MTLRGRPELDLAAAAAQFKLSLDGGNTWGNSIAVPVSGIYIIPNTGLQITFADGTFVVAVLAAVSVARFGDVDIAGNGRVSAAVIRRQLGFTPGEPFRQSAIATTQRRLYGLELFQFVTIEPGEVGADGRVPTRITLVEGKHRQVRFGVGWGTEDHARAEAEWKSQNFLGGARSATVQLKGSSLERGVRLSLTDPSLPGGASVGVSGQSWSSSTPAYALRTTGGRIGLLTSFGPPVAPGVAWKPKVPSAFRLRCSAMRSNRRRNAPRLSRSVGRPVASTKNVRRASRSSSRPVAVPSLWPVTARDLTRGEP